FLFTDENCVVHDEAGLPYTNEMIIPLFETAQTNFVQKQEDSNQSTEQNNNKNEQNNIVKMPKRVFSPYSEWLYFKVYCGVKSGEKILATVIHPFIEAAIKEGMFERFFFIRYYDESGGHFRIRFYNSRIANQLPLYARFMQAIQSHIDNGIVEKVLLDTY